MSLITSQAALEDFASTHADAPWLAFDLEFVRRKTYWPIPCLLQLAVPGAAVIVDLLAVPDIKPLLPLLTRDSTVKICHAGQQDVQILYKISGATPQPLYDTQVMAAFAGYGDNLAYHKLVHKVCRVVIDKSQQETDWQQRPLSAKQLDYALADVTHLADLYKHLYTILEEKQRLDWLDQDMALMYNADMVAQPAHAAASKPRMGRLPGYKQAMAMALSVAREAAAQAEDVPRQYILPDALLLDMANKPKQRKLLEQLPRAGRGHQAVFADIMHTDFRDQVEAGMDAPHLPPTPEEEGKILFCQLVRHTLSRQLGLPERLLLNNKDLAAWVQNPDDGTLTVQQGWRQTVVCAVLRQALAGQLQVKMQGDCPEFVVFE